MYETCPDTIPAAIGADSWLSGVSLYGTLVDWASCGSVLDEHNCADLNFAPPSANSSTFYKPNNFPPNGTQTLYNTGSMNAVTAPPSGSVITWSQSSVTYTATASPWKNTQVKATGTATVGPTGGARTVAGTAETGAATALRQSSPVGWLSFMVVFLQLLR